MKYAFAVATLMFAATAGPAAAPARLEPRAGAVTVRLVARHSRYEMAAPIKVKRGTTVRFEIVNADPIDHEFIVGPRSVHKRHEAGRERHHHGDVPGEVSVAASSSAATTYRFDRPGTVVFACHLPGHYAYGMHGTIRVA